MTNMDLFSASLVQAKAAAQYGCAWLQHHDAELFTRCPMTSASHQAGFRQRCRSDTLLRASGARKRTRNCALHNHADFIGGTESRSCIPHGYSLDALTFGNARQNVPGGQDLVCGGAHDVECHLTAGLGSWCVGWHSLVSRRACFGRVRNALSSMCTVPANDGDRVGHMLLRASPTPGMFLASRMMTGLGWGKRFIARDQRFSHCPAGRDVNSWSTSVNAGCKKSALKG